MGKPSSSQDFPTNDAIETREALASKQIEDRVFGAIGRSSSEVHKYAL
jgi:hypothetical protein